MTEAEILGLIRRVAGISQQAGIPSPFSTTEGEREKYLPVEEAGTTAAVTC
ncbi:hypothetical protein J8539_001612 [Escherichia coli]|nr:hypothetical protein [Escherichia coli]